MNIQLLVKMANQIESFFRSEPDRALAVKGIAGHIQRFWDPRMRTQIVAHVQAGGEGLGTLAVDAVKSLPPISAKYGQPWAA
ncbi:MAG TPA: formate dehydrogenase subunit delta [Burkholderiales bacterium]|jgi:formate dehydrogenase subunit delta|nr:formate dehydrogenase subunit delta [Burkholderiales bacterium]